ncbi:MAG: endopeptidase La [Sandaracinaceae bacterium]|nr:endopeptidase La [Sandaracinaceae bacterium]
MIEPLFSEVLPLLPLRNSVLFPGALVPINVGRPRSVRLVEESINRDRPWIAVVAQKQAETEDPSFSDVYLIGTVAKIMKVIRPSPGNYSVVVQGVARFRIVDALGKDPFMRARIERLHDPPLPLDWGSALLAELRDAFRRLREIYPGVRDSNSPIDNISDPLLAAYLIMSELMLPTSVKQAVLEAPDSELRVRMVIDVLLRQEKVHRAKKEITALVQEDFARHREIVLREQMRAIRRELGEEEDEDEIEQLRERVARARMPAEVERAARRQLKRMRSMSPHAAEYHVARTYVEWLLDIPWSKEASERFDLGEVRRVLDEDHCGLEAVKKRIVEFMAVRRIKRNLRGPILCFIGPPGVGKTSLAKSIARALSRPFCRVSLGGVQDEADIRGHRRTYVGSYPGRIAGALKQAGVMNPVMLLDEIDKMGTDGRGDPAAALLEVLDPEQNHAFLDHYLEVPLDLSQVFFIATANRKDTIPRALLDRMELIELSGYTQAEKRRIASDFIIPRLLREHGLNDVSLCFTPQAIDAIIEGYTREAGVRGLEQKLAAICRENALSIAEGRPRTEVVDEEEVRRILGPPRIEMPRAEKLGQIGVAASLAWTPYGGEVLFVEAQRMPGSGQLHLTGKIGEVMKESIAIALSFIRVKASSIGLPSDFLSKIDLHIHIPGGAFSKDGPAAGIAVFVALSSILTRLRVFPDVGMSGEITLRGHILPVQGIKEKCLAAYRAGLKRVLLPQRNAPDLGELPGEVRKGLEFVLVSKLEEVLSLVLDFETAPSGPASESRPSVPPPLLG